jgi:MinD-like ATPase involved in chromosome partitioning or flagellar assembly
MVESSVLREQIGELERKRFIYHRYVGVVVVTYTVESYHLSASYIEWALARKFQLTIHCAVLCRISSTT